MRPRFDADIPSMKFRLLSLRTRSSMSAAACAVALVLSACGGSTVASPSTSTASPVTTEQPPDSLPIVEAEAPSTPTGVTVVDTRDGAIELVWDASRDQSVTGYELTRVDSRGAIERISLDSPAFVDEGLDDGEIITYRVAAVSPAGVSVGSESITARVGEDTSPPTIPGRPKGIEGEDVTVALSWSASNDVSGIASYEVVRTIDGTDEVLTVEENMLLDDVAAGTVVTYAVRALDTQGNISDLSRPTTLLAGSTSDRVVIVVSAVPDPATTADTNRLRAGLLDAGFAVSWFEDDVFDANVTRSDDVVLLLGDVVGEGFDWNVFLTDSSVIGLKSMFMEASGLTENPPKFDRLAQLEYFVPGEDAREVALTVTARPKPVVFIPENEQAPALQVWARPVWSDSIAVIGLIAEGDLLANDKPAPGCRAFFPGNNDSLAEQTNAAWDLLFDFVDQVERAC